uniref:Uncharacterized protein n=1 Tax=Panagrolaimus davidi TaxID=227884 RepID=A0A914PVU5_9BILA
MLVAGIFMLLFFIEYSNGILPADCGVSCVRQKTSTGIDFAYVPHEDFVVWTPPNQNLIWIYYCKTTLIEQCYNDKDRTQFLYLDFQWKTIYRGLGHYFERVGDNKIHKYDVAVMEPTRDFVYPIDVTAFNFPAFWYYFDNNPILQVFISAGNINTYDSNKRDINNVFFVDEEDKCKSHRPTVLKRENFLNLNLYVNRKHARYSYFFIKKDNFICAYVFEHEQLFQKGPYMGDWDVLQIKPINFHMINNYPTQNYAPNFFCIDVLYGTFVSLYWDGHSHRKFFNVATCTGFSKILQMQ